MARRTGRLVVDARCVLGESPVYCAATKMLNFVDITGQRVFEYDPRRYACRSAALPQMVGTVVPVAGGGLAAALEDRVVGPFNIPPRRDAAPGKAARAAAAAAATATDATRTLPPGEDAVLSAAELPVIAAWEAPSSGCRFNDGKCDPSGELWVGTYHKSWRDAGYAGAAGSLLAVRAGGVLAPLVDGGVRISNGMAWSQDGRAFFYTDSHTQRIDVFDVRPDADGAPGLSRRRPAVVVPKAAAAGGGAIGGVPDGLTLDAAGKLWAVLGESGHVVQYDPETGRQIAAVHLPVDRPTALTFGGADLSELYVTSREEASVSGAPSPHAGGLFVIHMPGVKGAAAATPMRLPPGRGAALAAGGPAFAPATADRGRQPAPLRRARSVQRIAPY